MIGSRFIRPWRSARQGLRHTSQFLGRGVRSRPGGITCAVLLVLFAVGGLIQLRIDTSTESFLPTSDSTSQAFDSKAQQFGGDPIAVSLSGKKPQELLVDQEQLSRLLNLEGRLAKVPDVATVYGPATSLNQIAGTMQDMMAQLSGQRDAMRNVAENQARQKGAGQKEIQEAGQAATGSFDQRYGPLIVQGMPAGLPTLRNSNFVRTVVFNESGAPRDRWDFLVPSQDSVTVLVRPREGLDPTAAARLTEEVRSQVAEARLDVEQPTITGTPVVTAGLSERAQQEFPVLGGIAVLAVGAVFFCVPWTRRKIARFRPPLAALAGTGLTLALFGWLDRPMSLGVVAFLPILLGIGSDFPLYLTQRGGRRRRILVTVGAAAAGFAALAFSPLPFVREFGIALALGIVFTAGMALLWRTWFGPVSVTEGIARAPRARPSAMSRGRRTTVLLAALVAAGLGLSALPDLPVSSRIDQLAQGLPELQDAKKAEQVLGASGEVSVMLRGQDVTSPAALDWERRAQDAVIRQHGDEVKKIITVNDMLGFLGNRPTGGEVSAAVQLLPNYLLSSVISPDHKTALNVFGIKLQDMNHQRDLLNGIQASLPPPPPGTHAELVGLPVTAVSAFDAVSEGRSALNLIGIVAAGALLLIGLGNRRDAGRAILTVVLATGWVLALTWLTAGSLNPLTLAIGCLTTATGCEFAVMLTDARRRAKPAIGRSAMMAALAGVLGYLTLALSDLAMLREFGLLLAASVCLSFLAASLTVWLFPPAAEPGELEPEVEQRSSIPRKELTSDTI